MFNPFSSLINSRNFVTFSKLSRGSPLPIKTMLETFSPMFFSISYICSNNSEGLKFLSSPLRVEAQNLQPIRHPDCVEIHTELP